MRSGSAKARGDFHENFYEYRLCKCQSQHCAELRAASKHGYHVHAGQLSNATSSIAVLPVIPKQLPLYRQESGKKCRHATGLVEGHPLMRRMSLKVKARANSDSGSGI